ncbi:copper chaperone PCu(A)C [Erythrobacter litoralis]|uniref:Copper chaperone PCu(A)C n=1 Tax=Erythrobacter litoralis (strain HTCC2594) TaxID=314225 RepID=Q2NAI9_ERYLH|nr:copper chaperone PCu(A)C [Erythrobacter litoralis]ABC63302.1 hypothetical protein ELI_06050 [Erythrobacter litoralis HTCC2594]
MKQGIAALALGLAGISLAACGETAEAPAVEETGIPGMSVTNARMVLAPVEGNPAAVYFDLSYEGERGLTIRKADVAAAESAVMHQFGEYDFKVQMMEALPIALTQGTTVEFKPGDLHVMAMGVSPDLKPGDTTNVTLTVSGGGTYTFPAEVRAAGEDR